MKITFNKYVSIYKNHGGARGDFYNDWSSDKSKDKGKINSIDQLQDYLRARQACNEAIDVAKELFREYWETLTNQALIDSSEEDEITYFISSSVEED